MALKDIENRISVAQSLTPSLRNATINGTAIDLQGFNSAMMVFNFGTWTDGTHTPTVQHSIDNSTFVTCDTNSLNGTLALISSGAGSNTVQKVGYTGGYRYIRAVMTITGATTGAFSNAVVLRSHPSAGPV
jgi:hypothetical protein